MNVIRMIKLFGWEGKVENQIDAKRDEELKASKSQKLRALANSNVKSVILRSSVCAHSV